MPISFYDEEEFEYSEGLEVFTEFMDTKKIATESTTSPVTRSESTRNVAVQRATTSNRPPSPMDVDSGDFDMETERVSLAVDPGVTAKPAPTGPVRTAAPAKRATETRYVPVPTTTPHSPSALLQPAKRPQPTTSKPRKHAQLNGAPEFGTELTPFIIAHDKDVQALLDEHGLAWGTVYEIARGISKQGWKWSSVSKEKVALLRGSNAAAAPKVAAVIKGIGHESARDAAADVWTEYDREQKAIVENKGRGLGGMGAWEGKDDWYGGRIQQVGKLLRLSENAYTIQLEKPEIRRSHRFSRFLGSRRILQLKVAEQLMFNHGEEVRRLLRSRKFIICGRVFLPFHAKEGSAYLLETKEDYERGQSLEGDDLRMSLREFMCWHNPLQFNQDQPISKWSTRWALGLSTSVPTIVFDPQYIFDLDDEYASPKDWEGKAPAEKILTDGCGFINGAALTQILRVMKYGSRPTAVQGRIGGSKGMWILHPDSSEQVPDGPAKIWIRPSQLKIKLGSPFELGVAQRMFDLLAPSRVTFPSRLSSQTLVNLSHNKVSHQVLKELMAQGLREEIQPFIQWDKPHSMILVCKAVERAGNVAVGRLRRLIAGQARALGLGQLRPKENQDPDDDDEEEEEEDLNYFQVASGTGHKKYSGQPVSLHETVLELLQAGFHPKESELLFKKLETVVTMVLDSYVEKFHIPVKESCEAYIVPDPYGVLEENQIHFRSSEPFVSPTTGEQTDIILGPVLVSRNPTRLPSDIQKVQAVAHPKLSNYFNVIVFPIKGKQSLASFLGGGDYDGDTVMVNWYRPLVDQFRGSQLSKSPDNLFDSFEREVEKVKHFDERVSKLGLQNAQEAFQNVLLLGLAETRVGTYSKFQDAAVYELGYGHSESIHLAYMFTTCLDASKTGLRVKLEKYEQDRRQWGGKTPWYAWELKQAKATGNEEYNQRPAQKRLSPPFILDVLVEEGIKLKNEQLHQYRLQKEQSCQREDKDLSKPWKDAMMRAREAKLEGIFGFHDNLEDIEAHVNERLEEYRQVTRAASNSKKGPQAGKLQESSSREKPYDEIINRFAGPPKFRRFVYFSDDDVLTLKASLASMKNPNFGFSVAFHRLCTIKARAQAGGHVTVSQLFSQCQTIPNVVARMLSQPLDKDD